MDVYSPMCQTIRVTISKMIDTNVLVRPGIGYIESRTILVFINSYHGQRRLSLTAFSFSLLYRHIHRPQAAINNLLAFHNPSISSLPSLPSISKTSLIPPPRKPSQNPTSISPLSSSPLFTITHSPFTLIPSPFILPIHIQSISPQQTSTQKISIHPYEHELNESRTTA